jgi:hypothetical protein
MATSDNFDDIVVLTLTGCTVNVPVKVTSTMVIPLQTVTSSTDVACKVFGRVNGMAKLTGETFTAMQDLFWNVSSSGLTATFSSGSTTPFVGKCASKAGAATTASTCDIILGLAPVS